MIKFAICKVKSKVHRVLFTNDDTRAFYMLVLSGRLACSLSGNWYWKIVFSLSAFQMRFFFVAMASICQIFLYEATEKIDFHKVCSVFLFAFAGV